MLRSESFQSGGFTMNFFNGYPGAANQSMKKIPNKMIEAFASEEFHRALER